MTEPASSSATTGSPGASDEQLAAAARGAVLPAAAATGAVEWSQTEPGWLAIRTQLSRLRRRALARPLRVSLVTLFATLAVIGRQANKRETFDASVTFRAVERSGHPNPEEGQYQTKARLREYVADGVLTKARCLEVIQRLGLYRDLLDLDPNRAIDAFRDDITIRVLQNYFLREDWEVTGKPRTARVVISFNYTDGNTALKAARAIGELVRRQESEIRLQLAKVAAARAQAIASAIRRRLDVLHAERARRRMDLAETGGQGALNLELYGEQIKRLKARLAANPGHFRTQQQLRETEAKERELRNKLGVGGETMYLARLRVDLSRINTEIEKLELAQERADSRQTENDLRAGLEQQQLLMSFEPVDWGREPRPRMPRAWRLAILGGVLFVFLWPAIGIGVGAFDSRVYDLDDVRHLKLLALGHVPSFVGDDVGCSRERTKDTRTGRRQLRRATRHA